MDQLQRELQESAAIYHLKRKSYKNKGWGFHDIIGGIVTYGTAAYNLIAFIAIKWCLFQIGKVSYSFYTLLKNAQKK